MSALKYAAFIGRFGFSVILPVILCIWGADFLIKRFALPEYVMAIGIILGLCTGAVNFVRFCKYALSESEKNPKVKERKP